MYPLSPWGHRRVHMGTRSSVDPRGHVGTPEPECGRVLLEVTEGMGRGCQGVLWLRHEVASVQGTQQCWPWGHGGGHPGTIT